MEKHKIMVSVIMPIYNEEKYIDRVLQDLVSQNFPREEMEWIMVDGNSSDYTIDIIEKYCEKYKREHKGADLPIVICHNDKRTIPNGLNIGIAKAEGDYIIRLDAHASYPFDYITKCIQTMEDVEADDVGGIVITQARTSFGETIAKMLSTKFGVGNSQFRTDGKSGYVDTVPFGCFRRELFEKIGMYDTRFDRNEDNEFNYRIRKNGGKIYLNHDIHSIYYCRDTFIGICKMGFQNGMWNVLTMKAVPGSMGLRHFVPFAFMLSLTGLILLSFLWKPFFYLLILEFVLYMTCDIYFSAKVAKDPVEFLQLLGLYFSFHYVYGLGSLVGLFKMIGFKKD